MLFRKVSVGCAALSPPYAAYKRHPGERRGPVHFAFRIDVETQWAFATNGKD